MGEADIPRYPSCVFFRVRGYSYQLLRCYEWHHRKCYNSVSGLAILLRASHGRWYSYPLLFNEAAQAVSLRRSTYLKGAKSWKSKCFRCSKLSKPVVTESYIESEKLNTERRSVSAYAMLARTPQMRSGSASRVRGRERAQIRFRPCAVAGSTMPPVHPRH